MVPVFYALGETRYPVIGSFIAVTANIIIISLTIDAFQHKAIALSTSCTMAMNFLFLGIILCRKLTDYSLIPLIQGCVKIISASLVMGGGVWYGKILLSSWLTGKIPQQLVAVFLLIGVAVVIYYAVLYTLKLPELTIITKKFVQRFRKS